MNTYGQQSNEAFMDLVEEVSKMVRPKPPHPPLTTITKEGGEYRRAKPKPPENVIVIHNDLFGWLRGFPWLVTAGTYRWAMDGWRRAAEHHEELKRELADVSNKLLMLERIHTGNLVDESHIEWREDKEAKGMNFPFDSFMRAHCVHCGKQRSGIEAEYKGKRYFKPCYNCHCDGVCRAFSMAEAILG